MAAPRSIPLVAACIALSLACEASEPKLEAGNLARQEVLALCDFLERCEFTPDHDSCRASLATNWGLVQALGVSNLGRVEYDPEAARVYIETLRERSCEATEENAREISNLYDKIFAGKVEIGDPCFASEECVGDGVCDLWACPDDQACCTGRCVEKRIISTGDACPLADSPELYSSECELGSFCRPPPDDDSGEPPVSGVCAPRVDNGQQCVAHEECLDGQRCDLGGDNECYRLSAAGEPCNPLLSEGSCLDFHHVCDPGSSTCVPAPGPGSPCVSDRCIGFAVCVEGTCVARPRLGEPCDGGVPCLGALFCNGDGVCEGTRIVFACFEGEDPPPPEEMD